MRAFKPSPGDVVMLHIYHGLPLAAPHMDSHSLIRLAPLQSFSVRVAAPPRAVRAFPENTIVNEQLCDRTEVIRVQVGVADVAVLKCHLGECTYERYLEGQRHSLCAV
jgi:hypothetical protein